MLVFMAYMLYNFKLLSANLIETVSILHITPKGLYTFGKMIPWKWDD